MPSSLCYRKTWLWMKTLLGASHCGRHAVVRLVQEEINVGIISTIETAPVDRGVIVSPAVSEMIEHRPFHPSTDL